MTDENFDPWKSLASELGVKEQDAPRPPAPTSPLPTSPPTAAHRPPAAKLQSAAPKTASSDWSGLASQLGLEVPPEPEVPLKKHDPVAEALGFPPPPSSQRNVAGAAEEHPPGRRNSDRGDRPRLRDDWEAGGDDDLIERFDENEKTAEAQEPADTDRPKRADSDDDSSRRPRRRGRRGRGRSGAGGQRSGGDRAQAGGGRREGRIEDRDQTRRRHESLAEDRRDAERTTPEDFSAEGAAAADLSERGDEDKADDRPRRRRRRGRGGRGPRDERAATGRKSDASDKTGASSAGPVPDDDDLDIDFVEIGYDGADAVGNAPIDDLIDVAAEGDAAFAEEGLGSKSSVRDILTWKQAIGIMIENNMQARSQSPHGSHGGHGSRGPRAPRGRGGRGRGRGGPRGG